MNNRVLLLNPELNPEILGLLDTEKVWMNLHGDYTYMTWGYYLSLDTENEGRTVVPTTRDILDAYVVPIALEKAAKGGLDVPVSRIVNFMHEVRSPFIAYPLNPFSAGYEIVETKEETESKIKRVTMSGKYATHVQDLPENFRVDTFRCIMGMTLIPEYSNFARTVFDIFHLPLMKVKVIVTPQRYLFSSIEPLPYEDLTLNEKRIVEEMGKWRE